MDNPETLAKLVAQDT